MEQTFWESNGDWIGRDHARVIAFAIAFIVDRFVIGRATRVASRVSDTTVSRAARPGCGGAQAGLRGDHHRRLGIALSEFDKLNKLANADPGLERRARPRLGFAARQILANPMAGILLAITQPIRIGDSVTIEDETGRVEDLTLSHTFVDTGDGRLVIVPNEGVVTNVVVNRSTGDPQRAGESLGMGAAGADLPAPARPWTRSSHRRSTSPRSPRTG